MVGRLGPAEFALAIRDKEGGFGKKRSQPILQGGGFILSLEGADHEELVARQDAQKLKMASQSGGEIEVGLGDRKD